MRYYAQCNLRASEIDTEVAEIVPLTVDAYMSVIYSKWRSIDLSYNKLSSIQHASHSIFSKISTQHTSHLIFTMDVELLLPLTLAIQELCDFETHDFNTNYVIAPTYPEGTS